MKKFYKFKVSKQASSAMERSFLNQEEEWEELEREYSDLRISNRANGLTKLEAKRVRELISLFNDRGAEYKSLTR